VAGDEVGGLAHGGDVRADIYGVGDEQQGHQGGDHPPGHHPVHVLGETPAGHPADVGADQLDRAHQREGQDHGPEQAVAELGAGLGIGGDTAGVVVGGAGNQPRSELTHPARIRFPAIIRHHHHP
jgi:hypothetical protein